MAGAAMDPDAVVLLPEIGVELPLTEVYEETELAAALAKGRVAG